MSPSNGCGLLNAVFGRTTTRTRRSTSTGSIPSSNLNNKVTRVPSTPVSKRRKNDVFTDSNDDAFKDTPRDRIIARPGPNYVKTPYKGSPVKSQQAHGQAPRAPHAPIGISGELNAMINDHLSPRGANENAMLYGNLGNLRQQGSNVKVNVNVNSSLNSNLSNGKSYPINGVMGNVVKTKRREEEPAKPVSLCRALSTRMDPEKLKILGNEDYKNGRFAEAVALYDAAISIDPNKASYRSNKSAALTAMGKLFEAAFECREAIRIDPFYQRAHNRLATLYVRLGEAEKAAYHFKQSGEEADPDAMSKGKQVQIHLNKCTEAKRQKDWNTIFKETCLSISAGADSAPLIFALKAEALLKLNKHQEAIETMVEGPNLDIDDCIKFFGPIGSATLLVVRAQVDLVSGRIDDAVAAAQRATSLDSNNREANIILRRTRSVAIARSNGNELFKEARYSEACVAYGEGLNHDPYNAVLLSNRAACRSKLGQYQKAIEDCNTALKVRPSYSKARLRRADCYAKIEKWGACLQDCEVLRKENPEDEEVVKILTEAMRQVKSHKGSEDIKEAKTRAKEIPEDNVSS